MKDLSGEQTPNQIVKDKGKMDIGKEEGQHQRLRAACVKIGAAFF